MLARLLAWVRPTPAPAPFIHRVGIIGADNGAAEWHQLRRNGRCTNAACNA